MKRLVVAGVLAVFLFSACTKNNTGPVEELRKRLFILNGLSETIDEYEPDSGIYLKDVVTTGITPNALVKGENYLFVINSGFQGTPSVEKIDLNNLSSEFYDMPENSNPFEAVYLDGYLYITSLLLNRVYMMDIKSGRLVDSVQTGRSPQGIATDGKKIYVVSTFYSFSNYTCDTGKLYILDTRLNILDSLKLLVNPLEVRVYRGQIYVIGSDYNTDYGYLLKISKEPLKVMQVLQLPGLPGHMDIKEFEGNPILAITGFSMPVVFVNPLSFEILDTLNVLNELPQGAGVMDIELVPQENIAFVAIFNSSGENYLLEIDPLRRILKRTIRTGESKGTQELLFVEQ